jgi:hypothetical protein
LQTRKQDLLSRGVTDTTQTDEAIQAITNGDPDQVLQSLNVAQREAVNRGLTNNPQSMLTAGERDRQSLSQGFTDEEKIKARRIEAGLSPRAGMSAQERIATNEDLGRAVVGQEAAEVTATESAKQPIKVRTEALLAAQKRSESAIDTITNVRSEITNLDSAIEAIESGAESGKVSNWFPSFRSETLKLQNAASRLGLNVVTATTFGALSEGELKLAMDVAVPTGLQPKELKEWLTVRKNARVKLSNELEKMAIALGSGEMTSSEYLKKQKESDPLGLGL